MKKLMTMFASAATLCALGVVNAEGLTSTGFETAGYDAGQDLSTTNDDFGVSIDSPLADKVWVPTELESGVAVVTAYDDNTMLAATNVSTFTSTQLESNYLKLDSAPLISRYAQTGGEAYEIPSEGIYIDTLVKFTVSEDTPDQDTMEGDKLCIWVNVNSETGVTNLMVKAGYISDDSGENIAPTSYVTDYSFDGDGIDNWHRLTVKAIAGIDKEKILYGFVIYVDGVVVGTSAPVMCNDWAEFSPLAVENAFPSLIAPGSAGGGTLESIGFKGSGSIDNVQFTTTNPIPSEGGWVDDPTEIADNTPASTQYPALVGSALATADAKKLTVWAKANNITFAAVADDTTGAYKDAYLLNCAPEDVEDEKDAFVMTISFDSEGNPQITAPDYNTDDKAYNGRLIIKGSDDLSIPKANWDEKTTGDTFFFGVLDL